MPQLFRLPFRISRNQRAGRAGCGFRRTKDPDVVVNLTFEGINVNEAVDPNCPKEMTDSLTNTPLRHIVIDRERRCEGPPISPTEYATQNVHHHGQGIAFMSSTFAIRAEWQKGSSCDDVVRIC